MFMQFKNYKDEIKKYCSLNGFDFQKLSKMSKNGDLTSMSFLYWDKSKPLKEPVTIDGGGGSEKLIPVLNVQKTDDGRLTFEQTEHTGKYLRV